MWKNGKWEATFKEKAVILAKWTTLTSAKASSDINGKITKRIREESNWAWDETKKFGNVASLQE